MTSAAVDEQLGKAAYDAYKIQLGEMGEPWDGLTGTQQNAWIAAARTVEAQVRERRDPYA
jgi:hypothetical protein